jgi:hypothetical protein
MAGTFAERIGAPLTVALGGGACIAGGAAFARRLPTLAPEARRIIVALQMAGGDPAQEVTDEVSAAATDPER